MPRLSCIIPVVGNAHGLETTLVSVLENFPNDAEIIVVHSAPYDDPYDLKSELRFIEAPRRTGYVGCANLGIQAARAPFVHLLSAGLDATEGWADAALRHFGDPKVAAVAPVVCNQLRTDEILAAGMEYHRGGRAEVLKNPPTSLGAMPIARAAFYRRSALNLFGGGFPAKLGNELAAAELGLSLRRAGFRTVSEPQCKLLGSARSCTESRGFGYGLAAERLFWRNLPAESTTASLSMHPFSVARDLLGSLRNGAAILQLAGRVAAYATLGDCRARHEQLRAAEELGAMRSAGSIGVLPAHIRIESGHRITRSTRSTADVPASHS